MSESISRNRRTKIIATIGPASSDPAMLETLFQTGVDIFRLNFSHGTHADKAECVNTIRALEKKYDHAIAILADLQGPKFRIGTFESGKIDLKEGQIITFDQVDRPGDATRIYMPHPEVFKAVEQGQRLYLDDGNVRLEITEKSIEAFKAKVINGRALSDKKGFNLPDTVIPVPPLTDKDKKDLMAALDLGVDWVAQSFVQKPDDLDEARNLIAGRAALMAKLEKPSAIEHLKEMIERADGIMLARGDLGVEMPPERVPAIQKNVVRAARKAGKPVVIATQMLESMINSPRPTRAEASDVATAVYDGTDAVMLSAETASGDYPVEAVTIMDRICSDIESDITYYRMMEHTHPATSHDTSDAITASAYQICQTINAACIATYSASGRTALRMARQRPPVPILCLSHNADVSRRLMLSYGVRSVYVEEISDFEEAVKKARQTAVEKGLIKKGERLIMTAGVPFGQPGSTNTLRIEWID